MMTYYNYLTTVSGVDKVMRTGDAIMADTEIIAVLGQGVTGRVSLVTYKGSEACMKEAFDWNGNHLLWEARALCRVDGAAGAPRLMAASEDGSVLIMEYCNGYTLYNFAAHVGPSEELSNVVRDIKLAVKALHAAGYTHGDIHGGNVMVCGGPGQYQVRLIDFGRCYELDEEDVGDEWKAVKEMLEKVL